MCSVWKDDVTLSMSNWAKRTLSSFLILVYKKGFLTLKKPSELRKMMRSLVDTIITEEEYTHIQ